MLEIKGHEVLEVEEVDTGNQVAIIKKHHTTLYKIGLMTDIEPILNEDISVFVQWGKFNIEIEKYENEINQETTIQVFDETNELVHEEVTTEGIILNFSTPGTYTIKTVNEKVKNAEMVVTV